MNVTITSFPEPLVTVEEAKVALGESGSDRDELISMLLAAAQAELDGPKGWVGITVAQQGLEVTFDRFDEAVRLPGPIIGDVVITYLGSDGPVVLDSSAYVVDGDGSLSPTAGSSWPSVTSQAGAISASYTAGMVIGEDEQRISLMKTAIILHVRMTMDGVDPAASRRAIEALVRPLWVAVM